MLLICGLGGIAGVVNEIAPVRSPRFAIIEIFAVYLVLGFKFEKRLVMELSERVPT